MIVKLHRVKSIFIPPQLFYAWLLTSIYKLCWLNSLTGIKVTSINFAKENSQMYLLLMLMGLIAHFFEKLLLHGYTYKFTFVHVSFFICTPYLHYKISILWHRCCWFHASKIFNHELTTFIKLNYVWSRNHRFVEGWNKLLHFRQSCTTITIMIIDLSWFELVIC